MSVVERIFSQILEMSITASYCVLAVLLLRWLFRKAPKRYTYLLWLVVAFRLVCPLTVDSAFSIFNLNLMPESMRAESEIGEQFGELDGSQLPENNVPGDVELELPGVVPESGGVVNDQPGTQVTPLPEMSGEVGGSESELPGEELKTQPRTNWLWELDWQTVGTWVWMAGMIVLSVFIMVSWVRLRLRVQTAVKVKSRVYETDEIGSAFVMGIIKPTIYLPVGLNQQEQEWILLHETCHIWRKDYLVKMLATVLTIVYWFNPLVWVAWFVMCRDMEMSCDEMALEGASAEMRKAYSRTLLTVATNKRLHWNAITAFGEVSVKSRIKHVLSFKKPAVWMGAMFAVIMVVILAVFGTNGQALEQDGNSSAEAVEPTSTEEASPAEREEITENGETKAPTGTEEATPEESEEITENGEAEAESDTEGTPEKSTDEPTTLENAGPDAWKEVVWQAFLNYDEANPYNGEYGEFGGAAKDLDGDGVADRMFWHKIHDYYGIEYLLLSGGEMIEMGETIRNWHEAYSLDVEGDGEAEIAIVKRVVDTAWENAHIKLLKKTETGWQAMPFVYADGRENSDFERIRIPLVRKKTDDTHLLVTQPECGVTVERDIFVGEFDHWGFDKGEYGPIDSEVSSIDIRVVTDSASNRPILQVNGNLGDKWVGNFVMWEMMYEDGVWKVVSFANTDKPWF